MKMKAERAGPVAELLRSLYKSLYSDAKDRNPRRVQGTCEWFTSHDRFQDWKDGKTCGLLWVSADPGCGKSVLSRYLVDEVLQSSSTSTTCYFFFKDDFEDQKSATGALCCVLRQLFDKKRALLQDSILKQFEEAGDKLLNSFRELWRILVSVSAHHDSGQIVCILDALDECEEQDRHLLVETLKDFYLEKGTNTNLKFLVTSRPYVNIERGFHDIQTKFPVIRLQGEGQSESEKIAREIDLVVEARITQLCEKLHLTKAVEEVMKRGMTQHPNRTYLWVYLVFGELENCVGHSSKQMKEHIGNIPATVDKAYEKILSRSPDKNKARKLLHMVVAAKRPLTLKEIAVAVAVEKRHTSYSQLDIEPEEQLRTWVRELCGLFVSILGDKIYLLHQTAAEFLVSKVKDGESQNSPVEEGNNRSEWKGSFSPGSSNLVLGSVCAQILLFTDVVKDVGEHLNDYHEIQSESLDLLGKKYPLLTYSVSHWADHLGDASSPKDASSTKELPLSNMLQLCSISESACIVQFPRLLDFLSPYRHAKALTPLVVASILGLAAVTGHLLKLESTDANERDPVLEWPPLIWALRVGRKAGRKAVVNTFIEAEKRYQQGSHLLKRLFGTCYVDLDAKIVNSTNRLTPLGWAVRYEDAYLVEKLLATGRVTVVKEMLFEAVRKDRQDILGALLGTGQVQISCTNNGRRLLSWAVEYKAVRATKYLLDTGKFDIGTEMQPQTNELPGLAYTAMNGADEILRLLLATGKVDIDFRNFASRGRTPLLFAAEAGAQECVRLLLAMGNVAVNTKDLEERTPLSHAAEGGHEGIVQQLLATDKVIVDTKDRGGLTPLSYAARGGHEGIAQQLLAMKADINAKDVYGRTPFLAAAACCRERFVNELLAVDGVDVNTKDHGGFTPLMVAIGRGFEEVVRRLLATGKVDVNADNCRGYTPLELAVKDKRLNIVKALLEAPGVIITPDCWDLAWDHHEVDDLTEVLKAYEAE